MSRLNATIKLVVFLGETFFLIVSIFCTIASSLVYSGKILSVDFSSARQTAFKVLLLSCAVLFCTVMGCCGVANQLVRRGYCHGRRILCLHQFLLIIVLVSSISQVSTLRKREMSLELVMVCAKLFFLRILFPFSNLVTLLFHSFLFYSCGLYSSLFPFSKTNVTNYPTYDSFEDRLNTYFNHAYFDWICNPTFSWAGDWIDEHCPISMASQSCEPVTKKGEAGNYCDTFCPTSRNERDCCPSQELCSNDRKEDCPYHQCRVEVLRKVYRMIKYV